MKQFDDETIGKFEAAMEAAGWRPVRDRFGNLYDWKHKDTGKEIGHKNAFYWWWMGNEVPAKDIK